MIKTIVVDIALLAIFAYGAYHFIKYRKNEYNDHRHAK